MVLGVGDEVHAVSDALGTEQQGVPDLYVASHGRREDNAKGFHCDFCRYSRGSCANSIRHQPVLHAGEMDEPDFHIRDTLLLVPSASDTA